MKKSLDSLTSDGRKLQRQVMMTRTHNASLTFVCGISMRSEQMDVVEEARGIMSRSNNNILETANALSKLKLKYRHLGCVGYCLSKP